MEEKTFRRLVLTLAISAFLITTAFYVMPVSRATAPTVNYIFPSGSATFISVWRTHGVNYTVNVSDVDSNLQQVVLQDNASGSWVTFYDSGSLNNVSYHNHSGTNSHWVGSWVTYYWKVCAYDGVWTNITYNFTTAYAFGDPHCIVLDDTKNIKTSVEYKNTTGDYYLWADIGNIGVKTSTNGEDWITHTITDTALGGDYPYNAFTYNNIPYLYYSYYDGSSDSYLYYMWYNQTAGAWQSGSTGVLQRYPYGSNTYYAYGADVKYYDGKYQIVAGHAYTNSYLKYYTSDNPLSGFTYISYFESGYQYYPPYNVYSWFMPSLQILNGKLVLTYIDTGRDLHWRVYDGASWTDKGDIEADLGTSSNEIQGHWQSTLRDPVNNQLVCVYINASDWLIYRTLTDPDGTWSNPVVIYKPQSGETIAYPHADYIDRRIAITFASNYRGDYNIYMISAPDYLSLPHGGILSYLNRVQFPDAVPNQQHVNSSVFYMDNIGHRPINWINWSFANIGQIVSANNIKLWGSVDNTTWTAVNTTDANGYINMTSTVWASGLPWNSNDRRYFKIEILNVGGVVEDLHSNDEGIVLKVGLGT